MPASKTKKAPAKTPAPAKANTPPVFVDGASRQSEDAAMEGHFVTIEKGDYAGRLAAYVDTLARGVDGYPTQVLVRTRDADNLLVSVPYKDVKHADTRGGR